MSGVRIRRWAISARANFGRYNFNAWLDRGRALQKEQLVTDPKYAAFTALDPFFDIVLHALAGLVDGDNYFDTIADDAEFEFRYNFPRMAPETYWS